MYFFKHSSPVHACVACMRSAPCACAHCVDEWTGEYKLDAASVPEDVRPTRIKAVGRYAIQIHWTDGHGTGIYSFDRLRELADRAEG